MNNVEQLQALAISFAKLIKACWTGADTLAQTLTFAYSECCRVTIPVEKAAAILAEQSSQAAEIERLRGLLLECCDFAIPHELYTRITKELDL